VTNTQHPSIGLPFGGHRILRDDDPSSRFRAVATSEDHEVLSRALSDSSPDVARAAIGRLVELHGARASKPLNAVLLDADISIVADLGKALRELHDPDAFEHCLSGLDDERYTRRLAAAMTLGILGDTNARPYLCEALGDPIAAVRAAALDALTRIGPAREAVHKAAPLLTDTSPQVRIAAVRLIAGSHPRPGALLSAVTMDREPEVRCELAHHMSKLNDTDVRQLLADPDEGVRCQAARCADRTQMPLLGTLLSADDRPEVRRAAAHALGAIGGQAAAEALIAGIEDSDGIVRASVLHALERVLGRKGATMRLATELHSCRAHRRLSALHALARFNDCDRTVMVWRLADDPDLDVRLAVLETAAKLLTEPEALLMYMGTDANAEVRQSAQRRLAARA
jgi:HEAT repeat protein